MSQGVVSVSVCVCVCEHVYVYHREMLIGMASPTHLQPGD